MLRRIRASVETAIFTHPRTVVGVSAAGILLALIAGLGVEFRSSRTELVSADDPDQRRWLQLIEEYGATEALIACVESAEGDNPDPLALQRVADRLAESFAADPAVESVFHRIDLDWFVDRAAHFIPTDDLRPIAEALSSADGEHPLEDLADLNHRLASGIRRGISRSTGVTAEARRGARLLEELARAQRGFLEQPLETLERWEQPSFWIEAAAGEFGPSLEAYPGTRDRRSLFLFVSPRDRSDRLEVRRSLVTTLRQRAREVLDRNPGYRVAFTGQPALVVDEMDTVRRDTWLTSLIAVTGVGLLTLTVFRWRTHAALVLAGLATGLVWSFGAIRLELGYLNMITSSFISTLAGVAVAYGIHPMSEYELEGAHLGDPRPRVRQAFQRTGAGVLVAGATTAAAFFSIQLMRFRGFAELGLVAGFGVLLCLLAATVTLPALLLLYGTHRRRKDERTDRPSPMVDRFWVERLAGRVCRHPRWIVGAAAIVTALALWGSSTLRFDLHILDLLPEKAESLRYQRKMVLESDLSPLNNIVVAEDLDELRSMAGRAADEATILRFESVLDLLPAPSPARTELLAELRRGSAHAAIAGAPRPFDARALVAALSDLEEALALSAEEAFGAGLGELVGPLEQARAQTEQSVAIVRDSTPAQASVWNEAQARLLALARGSLARLRASADFEAPSPENLPAQIRQRYLTGSGKPLGFLHPAVDLFDSQELEAYVAASRRVAPDATGFPLVFDKMARRISGGFYRAVFLGSLIVTVILLIDYRRAGDALLALVPLAVGVVWMMGAMRLLGISFNFANLVAVPLIIGVGIDNGVHVIHRVRLEGREGMAVVLRHTGRAILIASLTTMIGFGSLALASHRGLASLGLLLLLGVGACLVTSTILLPNLLVLLGRAGR